MTQGKNGLDQPRELAPELPRLHERVPSASYRSNRERTGEGTDEDDAVLDAFLAWVADVGLTPYPAQEQALLELMTGHHVVLETPTGSGKSLVALGLHFKALSLGRRSFYTAPIKALVNQKFFELCEQFGPENVGMLTGDASINWSAPVICCTAEVLSNMAVGQGEETDAPYVIMDEFHYYDDRARGIAWQIPLIALEHSQFLLLSATLGNTRAIEERLRARTGREVVHVSSDERPVPLDFEYAETPLLETIDRLRQSGKAPIYVVNFTQRDAALHAQALTSTPVVGREERKAIGRALSGFRFDTPYGPTVKRLLSHGVGLHHAGLLPRYRRLVERLAEEGLLKVIFGTDTLGMGVNVPIRTVLFTQLCKYDGEKVGILRVREFKQIAGRAGRRGFDERGSVVAQAPEWQIENKRLAAKASTASRGKRKRLVTRKRPFGLVDWSEKTFTNLVEKQPERLESRFSLSHGLVVAALSGSRARASAGEGYRGLIDLIQHCHEEESTRRALVREAAALFRSLRAAEVVELVRDEASGLPTVRISEDLQREFSLHQTLSLYLLDAVAALEKAAPDYAFDVLSLVEAIIENPRPILQQQQRAERGRQNQLLKAKGVPYDERRAKLEKVTWPKPNAEFIYATFNLFAEKHPWASTESIRPKSIAREMAESYASFDDYVKRCEIAAREGLLLRYLSQVHDTLVRSVPEAARNDDVYDLIGYLQSLVAGVDSSLLQEWESLLEPTADSRTADAAPATAARDHRPDPAANPGAFRARVRAEMHLLVGALSKGNFREAATHLRQDPRDPWDAARLEAALAPFFSEYQRIIFDPRAKQAHHTQLLPQGPLRWEVRQVLVDEAGDNFWHIEGVIDLSEEVALDAPLVALRQIGT